MNHLSTRYPIALIAVVTLPLFSLVAAACGNDDSEIPPVDDAGQEAGADGTVNPPPPPPPIDGGVDATLPSEDGGDAGIDAGPVIGLNGRPANTTCKAFTAPPPTGQVRLVNRFPGIGNKIATPTGMFQRPGDNARWYVTERGGRIWTFPNTPNVQAAEVTEVLNLTDVTQTAWDCSMSGVAFPANFATTKRAYVSYCYIGPETGTKLQVRVSRFATTDGGLTFDRASEQVILALDHPGDAAHPEVGLHTSDAMRFGKDGFLYMAIGDGGPQGKGGGTQAQDTNDMRGKLLRLDVSDLTKSLTKDFVPGRQRYAADIPPDNPFVGNVGGHAAVYAYGFRNPWQWHFDRKDNSIWLGDVGNGTWEEVDRAVAKGGNYGWSAFEGFQCTNHFPALCMDATLKKPLLVVQHGNGPQQGNAVTGGIVYRGTGVPSLTGSYVFGDSSRQHIWAVRNVDALGTSSDSMATQPAKDLLFDGTPVSSFAEDQDGELFATTLFPTGAFPARIWAVEEAPPPVGGDAGVGGPPDLLSKTGCFETADPKTPLPALIPYAPSAELFSDNATKRRWLAMPETKTIAIGADGDFDFPNGSVLVKEFSVNGKKIETRFFVRQDADGRWAAYTYQWNDGQTDAALVPSTGASLDVGGGQTWAFPTRAQCHQCHTRVAGSTLGLELAQLNHDIAYPSTGRTANQLVTLNAIGVLDALPAAPSTLPNLAAITDTTRTIEDRARGYVHSNCANCHRPEGPTFTPLDLRFSTTFKNMNICNALPTIDDLDALIPANPRLFAAGDPQRSVMYWRLATTDSSIRMPPVGRSLTHGPGVTLLSDWISATPTCPP